jgi:hypothetical protein
MNLYRDFGPRVQFVSVYVREAHPGERYPHHRSEAQKMRHAQDWVEKDKIPWTVVVDTLNGTVDREYGPLPNSAYLINREGRIAFRALWTGQEGLLRDKVEGLFKREASGEQAVTLGEQENLLIPMIHGAAEFDHAVGRGGKKAKQDFRGAMGNIFYGFQKLMSKMEPVVNPGNKDIE